MDLIDIRELFRGNEVFIWKNVIIGVWVRSNSDSKNCGFLVVNDGSLLEPLQIVYGNQLQNFDEFSKVNVGSAVIIKGTIV